MFIKCYGVVREIHFRLKISVARAQPAILSHTMELSDPVGHKDKLLNSKTVLHVKGSQFKPSFVHQNFLSKTNLQYGNIADKLGSKL